MLNIILFILLITIAILIIISISFNAYNSKYIVQGGGSGKCNHKNENTKEVCSCTEYEESPDGENICYNCDHYYSDHLNSDGLVDDTPPTIYRDITNFLGTIESVNIESLDIVHINIEDDINVYLCIQAIYEKFKQLNLDKYMVSQRYKDRFIEENNKFTKLLDFLTLSLSNKKFVKKIVDNITKKDNPDNIILEILEILIYLYAGGHVYIKTDAITNILKIVDFIFKYTSIDYILNIIILGELNPELYHIHRINTELIILFKIKFILFDQYNNNAIFKQYDAIELNFNTKSQLSTEIITKAEIYNNIVAYAKSLINISRNQSRAHIDLLIGEDNNRDKLLNNLGLLIVGITSTDYICILLYPILFEYFKIYQSNKESIQFGTTRVYGEFRKGIFEGGGSGRCNYINEVNGEKCNCSEYQDGMSEDNICYRCEHSASFHMDGKTIFKEVFSPVLTKNNIKYSYNRTKLKDTFKQAIKSSLDLFYDIDMDIPFFRIPIKKNYAKEWRPMLIKALNSNFFNTNYDNAKKFIINTHGSYDVPSDNNKTIDLYDNEFVVMSCNPFEIIGTNKQLGLMLTFYDKSDHKQFLMNYFKTGIDPDPILLDRKDSKTLTEMGRDLSYRDNYCIYTKRCPNLYLQCYDTNPFKSHNPMGTFEYPMQFTSNTIGEFLNKINSSIVSGVPPNMMALSMKIREPDRYKLPSILMFLNNDTDYNNPNYYNNYVQKFRLFETKHSPPDGADPANLDNEAWANEHTTKLDYITEKLSSDKNLPIEEEDRKIVKTYYNNLNPILKIQTTLEAEINEIRKYNSEKKLVIYFVSACRI